MKKGYIASVSTNKLTNLTKEEQNKMGIYSSHAYTLLYIVDGITDALTNQQTTLLNLRNPWGRGVWKGTWSFEYRGWTKEMRERLNYIKDPKDGSFFICL